MRCVIRTAGLAECQDIAQAVAPDHHLPRHNTCVRAGGFMHISPSQQILSLRDLSVKADARLTHSDKKPFIYWSHNFAKGTILASTVLDAS